MTLTEARQVTRSTSRASPPRILTRLRTEPIDMADAASGWTSLAEDAAEANAFFDPGFMAPAATALGANVQVLGAQGPDGRLAGLMPVTETRLGRLTPALTVWCHEYGPLGAPVLRRDCVVDAASALVEAAFDHAGPSRPLLFPMMPVGGPVAQAILAAANRADRPVVTADGHARAVLRRDGDGSDPRSALPRKRRKEYARLRRRMEEVGRVTLQQATAPDDLAEALEAFLSLEASGWKGRRGSALADDPRTKAFARSAVARLGDRGAASILRLTVGDRDAAMLICFHHGSAVFTWKIAYDEQLARFSPGALLMLDAPSLLFGDAAASLIDSCAAPDHPMIDGLWAGRRALATLVVMPPTRRMLARAGIVLHRAETRLRQSFRRIRNTKSKHRSQEDTHQ